MNKLLIIGVAIAATAAIGIAAFRKKKPTTLTPEQARELLNKFNVKFNPKTPIQTVAVDNHTRSSIGNPEIYL